MISSYFVVADKNDYISSALNYLQKQSNIEELDEDTDKEEIIKMTKEDSKNVTLFFVFN